MISTHREWHDKPGFSLGHEEDLLLDGAMEVVAFVAVNERLQARCNRAACSCLSSLMYGGGREVAA